MTCSSVSPWRALTSSPSMVSVTVGGAPSADCVTRGPPVAPGATLKASSDTHLLDRSAHRCGRDTHRESSAELRAPGSARSDPAHTGLRLAYTDTTPPVAPGRP